MSGRILGALAAGFVFFARRWLCLFPEDGLPHGPTRTTPFTSRVMGASIRAVRQKGQIR